MIAKISKENNMKTLKILGDKVFNIEIPDGFQVVNTGRVSDGDLVWNREKFIPVEEYHIEQLVYHFICVIRKIPELIKDRYVLDIRNGIAAVCDTQHPSYAERTPGLHGDNKYIISVEYGTSKSTDYGLCWDLEEYQIKRLINLCDLLNKKG